MTKNKLPALSVIIITPDSYETIRKAIDSLSKQTVLTEIELVIVAPEQINIKVDQSQLRNFFHYQIVTIDDLSSLGKAKAAGIKAANAPIIALIEEHVYPDPDWAKALIHAHQSPWAVVGPAVRNANPNNLISWADFLITYGQWMEPQPAGPVSILPGHNSSYKRNILLAYKDSLSKMLEVEAILQQDMINNNYQIYLDPKAIIYHLGFSKLFPSLPVQYHIGRLFGADRAKNWSIFKKIIYTCGSPLIPLVKLYRFFMKLKQSGNERKCPFSALPLTLPGLIYSAVGEMMGYALGQGDSKKKMIIYEFHRDQHL